MIRQFTSPARGPRGHQPLAEQVIDVVHARTKEGRV
jgi:hypothetical protein